MDERVPINRHIPALDGLRGLAVIAVVLCHVNWEYGGPFTSGRLNGPVAALLGAAWVGVDLFFVLSGFLITGILLDAKGGVGYFRNFFARRALRIWPLYYGFLLVSLVALQNVPTNQPALSRDDVLSLGLYYYNFRVADTHKSLGIFHPFWSLAIEEHFYLFWPVIVWCMPRRMLMAICGVLMAGGLVLRIVLLELDVWPMSVFFITPCRLDSLLAGAFVAAALREPRAAAWLGRVAWPIVVVSGVVLGCIAGVQGHFVPNGENATPLLTIGLSTLGVFFAGLLTLAVTQGNAAGCRRLLENRALCAVGKYSYAIYVFHALILATIVGRIAALRSTEGFLARPAAAVFVLALSFVAAWLSYHLYEKHFLRLKRYFEYRPAASESCLTS